MLKKVIIVVIILGSVTGHIDHDYEPTDLDPVVVTKFGSVVGSTLTTQLGRSFYAFRGIPFAKSPVGELRFKPPQAYLWKGRFDGRKDGPVCFQAVRIGYYDLEMMSEDCLRVSVYTKNLNNSQNILKPVIVQIHGGTFDSGGNSYERSSRPIYIMDQDIVFVTFNYRIGVLGFLSTGTNEAPGNNGFKDQVLALKWVRDNIMSFGGNSSQVTLFGHSSGAESAVLHLVSPMSRGLFHRAIVMSGSVTAQWKFTENQLDKVYLLADSLACNKTDDKVMFDCFNQTSAQLLTGNKRLFAEFQFFPLSTWRAVIEPDFGQERFLTEDPTLSILKGKWNKVPLITGTTKDELAGSAHVIVTNETLRGEMENEFERVAPICFLYERDTKRSHQISATLKRHFLPTQLKDDDDSLRNLQKLIGDSTFSFGVHRLVQLLWNHTEVFYYKSTFVGRFSYFIYPGKKPWGVGHADDLQYLTHLPRIGEAIRVTDPENDTVQRMNRLFANFAIHGNPNNPYDEYIGNVTWSPYDGNVHNYLEIGNELVMREQLFLDRLKIWDELFPLPQF